MSVKSVKESARLTAQRALLKEQGLCVYKCGQPAESDSTSCAACQEANKQYRKKRRADLKQQRLCVMCAKNTSRPNRTSCGFCAEKYKPALKIYNAKNYKLRREAGLCSQCGKWSEGRAICDRCIERGKKRTADIKAAGLCISLCGNPSAPGRSRCRPCLIKIALRFAKVNAKTYGYTPILTPLDEVIAWYDKKIETLKGRCEWCQEPFNERPVVIDHDHVTGEVRALVCKKCNMTEGAGVERLEKIVAAIRAWEARSR